MKRMEVPRLPLHNLQVGGVTLAISTVPLHPQTGASKPCLSPVQGNSGAPPPEAVKQHRPADIVLHDQPILDVAENHSEPSPPPSRVLRSGKRVPIGTATKVPPRTGSKASRVAVSSSDELPVSQVHADLGNPQFPEAIHG